MAEPPLPLTATTPFIGREADLDEVVARLRDPYCRLLTITGPGGAGKTRLAIQAMRQVAEESDDVFYAELESITSSDYVIHAIANALNVTLTDSGAALEQVADFLRERITLLVVDNFEHIQEAAPQLSELLRRTPGLTILVTSRVALNLAEEWRYPLAGLSLSDGGGDHDFESSPALQLFVETARRVRPDFDEQAEMAGIKRICVCVDGLPLAIQLAAAWTRVLDCNAIADEIERNIAFLSSIHTDMPARHRSVQAVSEGSWQLLNKAEQLAFADMSVFPGSFSREAVAETAGASLPVISSLVDKSMLTNVEGNRFRLHSVLRRFAKEKLNEDSAKTGEVTHRHMRYYAGLCARLVQPLSGGNQIPAADAIERDMENIKAACARAIHERDVTSLGHISLTLVLFFSCRSRYLENDEVLEKTLDVLNDPEWAADASARADSSAKPGYSVEALRVHLMIDFAWHCLRMGRFDECENAASEALFDQQRYGVPPGGLKDSDAYLPLGHLALIRENPDKAIRLANNALESTLGATTNPNHAITFHLLARAYYLKGHLDESETYAGRALAASRRDSDRWFSAYCLNELGDVCMARGDTHGAVRHFEESHEIRRDFGDATGMGEARTKQGEAELVAGEYDKAGEHFREAVELFRPTYDKGGFGLALCGLGCVAIESGDAPRAAELLENAFNIAIEIKYPELRLRAVAGAAELCRYMGDTSTAVHLASCVLEKASGDAFLVRRMNQVLAGADPVAPLTDTAVESAVAAAFHKAMHQPEEPDVVMQTPVAVPSGGSRVALPEPLTPRELEVLALINSGLSNQQIAEKLIVSTGTVKWHSSQIYSKLGVKSRVQ
ncbi:MAG: tetratricopeptide repeat protein, partial [Dehalococcoidia bacterium]